MQKSALNLPQDALTDAGWGVGMALDANGINNLLIQRIGSLAARPSDQQSMLNHLVRGCQ